MDAQELRIGNNANLNGADYSIKSIEWNGANQEYYVRVNEDFRVLKLSHLSPIPITEELLLKAGFEKLETGHKEYWELNGFEIEIHGDKFPMRIWGGESAPHLTQFIGHKTKFLHQLQNGYFWATGSELTFKQ